MLGWVMGWVGVRLKKLVNGLFVVLVVVVVLMVSV